MKIPSSQFVLDKGYTLKYLKKYAPHMIIGTGGIGVGVAISQPGKMERAKTLFGVQTMFYT